MSYTPVIIPKCHTPLKEECHDERFEKDCGSPTRQFVPIATDLRAVALRSYQGSANWRLGMGQEGNLRKDESFGKGTEVQDQETHGEVREGLTPLGKGYRGRYQPLYYESDSRGEIVENSKTMFIGKSLAVIINAPHVIETPRTPPEFRLGLELIH